MVVFLIGVTIFFLGIVFGMGLLAIMTTGKTSDLYMENDKLKRDNRQLKLERDSLLYTGKHKCTFDE